MYGTLPIMCPLVDRPTQLICIWIFICCQQTNTKDIAGQSAIFLITMGTRF